MAVTGEAMALTKATTREAMAASKAMNSEALAAIKAVTKLLSRDEETDSIYEQRIFDCYDNGMDSIGVTSAASQDV